MEQAGSRFKSVLRNMEQAGSLFYISKIGNDFTWLFLGRFLWQLMSGWPRPGPTARGHRPATAMIRQD